MGFIILLNKPFLNVTPQGSAKVKGQVCRRSTISFFNLLMTQEIYEDRVSVEFSKK